MIQELVAEVYERSARIGRPIDPPLLVVLDEAANIAPIPNLDEIASTGAGQGIQLLSVFQDLAQLHSRYGRRAQTIVNNHRAKLFGTGISDPETLTYVSRVVGAAEFSQRSQTAGKKGQRSTTEGSTYRDLTPANVIREAKPRNSPPPLQPPAGGEDRTAAVVRRGEPAAARQRRGNTVNEEPQSDWAAETVALRGAAEREEDAQREERLRRVSPRRRAMVPAPRWLALGALVLAVVLAGAILSSASGGGDPAPAPASPHQARAERQEPRLTKAREEYRRVLAALRARRQALRRNQSHDNRHRQRKTPHRKAAPPAISTTVTEPTANVEPPAPVSVPPVTSPPPPPESAAPTTVAPASQPQPVPVQHEFGLEH